MCAVEDNHKGGRKILSNMTIRLFKLLYETGPNAQSFYSGLDDPRVSRTDAAAEDAGFLDIADKLDLEDDPEKENMARFPEDPLKRSKITP